MKTINTVLPIYDKIAKQCYQRAIVNKNETGQTKPVPIVTPRFRLPSLQWNVESDNPGEITSIELMDTEGRTKIVDKYNEWFGMGFDTFVSSGLNITSAINLSATALAELRLNGVYEIPLRAGDIITIRGLLTLTGVAPHLIFREDDVDKQDSTMAAGNYTVTYTASADCDLSIILYYTGINNFSFTSVNIGIANINSYFNTTASYIQKGAGAGFLNNATAYDTFTSVLQNITSAIKTTAAGVASCWNVIEVGSVPQTINIGDTIRIKVVLTLTSGVVPKCVLQRTDTSAAMSNVFTLVAGTNYIFLTATETRTGFAIAFYNETATVSNWSAIITLGEKSVIPKLYTPLTDDYFIYNGETLGVLLPCGLYYLKITTLNGYVYYSDWFLVEVVYSNLITGWANIHYDTFTSLGTKITSAIEAGINGIAYSDIIFPVIKGEKINIICFLTLAGGELPLISVIDSTTGLVLSNAVQLSIGLNIIELTSLREGIVYFRIYNAAATNFSTSEILVIRGYSEKYLTINFSNTCDLGDIIYSNGFAQTVWFESETMENTYPQEEEGQKNGLGRFVRTFARQVKKYLARTKDMPAYMVDVFNRMKLHDTVEIIDLVGDTNDVYNLDVEHEWLFDDKYYAKLDLTFDYDEAAIVAACCTNIT